MKLEFKKYFYNKYTLIFLIAIILVNIFYFTRAYSIVERHSVQRKNEYMIFYPEIKGSKTKEKIEYIKAKKREMEELYMSDVKQVKNQKGDVLYTFACKNVIQLAILPDMQYCYLYYNENKNLLHQVKEKLNIVSDGSSFEKAYLELLIKKFQGRNIPYFGLTRGYELLFSYNLSVLFCLFFILVPISQIFVREKDKEYDAFVLSAVDRIRWGKLKIRIAVLSAIFFMSILYVVDTISFYFIWDMDYPFNPIYSIKSFVYTSFRMPIILYMFFNFFIKVLCIVFMTYLFMYHSIVSKNVIRALLKNVFSVFFIILVDDFFDVNFLPFNLLTNQRILTHFNVVNVFGFVVEQYQLNLVFSILVVLFLRILVYRRAQKW